MSVQAMTWAIEQQDIRDATARHVLLCLANYADADGKAAFPSTSRLESDTGATRAANISMAVAEAQKTFPLVREASAALPRTEFPGVNRAMQAAQTGTGDPRVVALGTALNTSVNAYARAISPTGVPTVSDKEHARELLSTASTPEQLNAVLSMMEKEMSAARQAPTEVQAQQKARISGRGEGAPSVGTVEGGYRFKGGDPSKQSNWEKM